MSVSPEFLDYLHDQLGEFGPVSVRRMFGGAGLFHRNLMIALISEETLYLKVDERNRGDFEAEGMEPFIYQRKQKPAALKSYYELPAEVIEDPGDLAAWLRKAYNAALAGAAKSKR